MRSRSQKIVWELLLLAIAAVGALLVVKGALSWYYRDAYPMKYQSLIDTVCEEKGLDPALVYAVVRTESSFNPRAQSNVGAKGLMQLMPDAFDWVRMRQGRSLIEDKDALYDPELNVDCGTEMLRMFLDEFGTVENALCAYHAGRGSLKSWLADPEYSPDGIHVETIPFADTRAYVKKVCKSMEIYRRLYQL